MEDVDVVQPVNFTLWGSGEQICHLMGARRQESRRVNAVREGGRGADVTLHSEARRADVLLHSGDKEG